MTSTPTADRNVAAPIGAEITESTGTEHAPAGHEQTTPGGTASAGTPADTGRAQRLVWLDPAGLAVHPRNVRDDLGDLSGLAASIAAQGVLEALTVVPTTGADGTPGYQLVAGHRRAAAAILAGVTPVPCVLRDDLALCPDGAGCDRAGQARHVAAMLAENLHRQELSAVEEARGVQTMLDLGESITKVAASTGLGRKRVAKAAGIARLDANRHQGERRGADSGPGRRRRRLRRRPRYGRRTDRGRRGGAGAVRPRADPRQAGPRRGPAGRGAVDRAGRRRAHRPRRGRRRTGHPDQHPGPRRAAADRRWPRRLPRRRRLCRHRLERPAGGGGVHRPPGVRAHQPLARHPPRRQPRGRGRDGRRAGSRRRAAAGGYREQQGDGRRQPDPPRLGQGPAAAAHPAQDGAAVRRRDPRDRPAPGVPGSPTPPRTAPPPTSDWPPPAAGGPPPTGPRPR